MFSIKKPIERCVDGHFADEEGVFRSFVAELLSLRVLATKGFVGSSMSYKNIYKTALMYAGRKKS